MELLSTAFATAVQDLVHAKHVVVLGTVPVRSGLPLVQELVQQPDVLLVELTRSNRGGAVEGVARAVLDAVKDL